MFKVKASKAKAEGPLYTIRDMRISKVMTKDLVTRDTSLKELGQRFETRDFNSFPVVENGRLVGILTELDFMRMFSVGMQFTPSRYWELHAKRVGDAMRRAPVAVQPDDPLEHAVEYSVEFGLQSLPVVDGVRSSWAPADTA